MDKKLIPVLAENWVIRGTREIPRLFNKITNKIIKLNTDVVNYILAADGTNSYKDIRDKFNLDYEEMEDFYSQFINEGIIEEIKEPKKKRISVNLGKKEPWLKEVHIDITNNCNLRCKHCFWGYNLKMDENTPKEKWFDLIHQLKKLGVAKVVISGGEAFTNNELLDVIKCCYRNEIMIASIFTNGTVQTDNTKKVIEYLTKKQLATVFYISLDGCNSEQHDFIRGKGNFDKTISFIKWLLDYKEKHDSKYNIMINSLLHKKNYKTLVEWYDYLEELGVYGWRFTTGRVTGFFKINADEIKVTSRECFDGYKKLVNHVIDKYNKKEPILYLNIENFFTTRALVSKKMYIFDGNLSICDYKEHACSVDPKGNVQFCTGWQNIKYGNVFEEGLEKIWYGEKLQSLKQMKIKDITDCQDCKYLKFCGGGCRLECKNIFAKDEDICENFELFESEMLPILESLGITFDVE